MWIAFFRWYLVVQLLTLVSLPLVLRVFAWLPDRGYALGKSSAIFLSGLILWLGTSYGLLRNESGGAWVSVAIVAGISVAATNKIGIRSFVKSRLEEIGWRYVMVIELLFLVAFLGWMFVRAFDPAADHTEQPMDLMFMNSIWVSPTYPPQDAWLAGYAISYYYFGYWLLLTIARLAGQSPEIAYNLGQACWFGLLLLGSFGIGANLLAVDRGHTSQSAVNTPIVMGTGIVASMAVGLTGNLQGIIEWLYALGLPISGLVTWFDVYNFPENAAVTGKWYIGFDWWWWRSSRVIEDVDLLGRHIEVIDEFPIFSYVLGDNHPHVLAMPFALLVIGLLLNFLVRVVSQPTAFDDDRTVTGEENPKTNTVARFTWLVQPWWLMGATLVALGALVFLNTWDFPPYWLLLVGTVIVAAWHYQDLSTRKTTAGSWVMAGAAAGGIGLASVFVTVLTYWPYFLTAQSQAGGFLPNLFHPTRLAQFILMFGAFMPALLSFLVIEWRACPPKTAKVALSALLLLGLPVLFLSVSVMLATGTQRGNAILSTVALPAGAESYLRFFLERWGRQWATFALTGAALVVTLSLLWRRVTSAAGRNLTRQKPAATFVLLMVLVGFGLVFAPEFIYLRDNFGTRMNTIFKFYYQAWLLFALSAAYIVGRALARSALRQFDVWTWVSLSSAGLIILGLVYPAAAIYSKTYGFGLESPTLDATAYIAGQNPSELIARDWIRNNVMPTSIVIEGKGASYRANTSRLSSITGRPTLLGWDGHEAQWRGRAYGEMAAGRSESLVRLYENDSPEAIADVLQQWDASYVVVGPAERMQYNIEPRSEEHIREQMDLVFSHGDIQIYRRRE